MDNIVAKVKDGVLKVHSDEEGMTGGYYDTEDVWHDFGEGGGTTVKYVTVTVVNGKSASIQSVNGLGVDDGELVPILDEIPANGHITCDCACAFYNGSYATYDLPSFENSDLSFSSLVNCTDSFRTLIITDPDSPASATMTITPHLG